MRFRAATLVIVLMLVSACVARERLNARCEWTGDGAGVLDLTKTADRRHLEGDVDVAEELGVRYGDAFRRTRGINVAGYHRGQCTEALLQAIAQRHGISSSAVRAARGRRPLWYELVVEVMPPATLLLVAAWPIAGGLLRRFQDRIPRLVATAAGSLAGAIVGYQIINMWSFVAESYRVRDAHVSYRVRDAHVSYRAYYLLTVRHPIVLLSGAAFVFVALAVARHRRDGPRVHWNPADATDVITGDRR